MEGRRGEEKEEERKAEGGAGGMEGWRGTGWWDGAYACVNR